MMRSKLRKFWKETKYVFVLCVGVILVAIEE